MTRRIRDERGDTTTEAVLVTPVLLLVITLIINVALWYHASQIARAATQEGARAAHVALATSEDGRSTTEDYIRKLGAKLVLEPQVNVTRDATTTRVELRGHSVAVVPGLHLPIHSITVAPNEEFRASP